MKKISLTLILLVFSSICCLAQTREINEIKITSKWGGLGEPQKSELLITRKSKGYYADGDRIAPQKIADLLRALNVPEIKEFQAANLGITQEWLNTNAEPAVKDYAEAYFLMAAPNQRELYLSAFKKLQFIEEILPSVLAGGWTDDYPNFLVEITGADGNKTKVESNAQPAFMLPWKIHRNGRTITTYNADISRAVVALLPKKFANRERLAGNGFRRDLAESVMREIEGDWEFLEVENKAGDALKVLKETYTIVSGALNATHAIDFGEAWGTSKSPGKNLQLVLRRADFPGNFAVSLKLPFQNERVENMELFQTRIDDYRELVFSVSWLKNRIESGAEPFRLRFVKNRSFSEKAMLTFADDMRKIGKSELIAEVEKEQEKIALIGVGGGLEYYHSYWLIMPDKKVILWRTGGGNLLDWNDKDFTSTVCPNYSSGIVKCIGATISPDGSILSE